MSDNTLDIEDRYGDRIVTRIEAVSYLCAYNGLSDENHRLVVGLKSGEKFDLNFEDKNIRDAYLMRFKPQLVP